MSARPRLAKSAIALLIPTLVIARWSLVAAEASIPDGSFGLDSTVGAWSMEAEQALPEEVLAVIDPDAYLMWLYGAPERSAIWIYVGLYGHRAGFGKKAHIPEACYPAQGWEVIRTRSIEVHPSASESLQATLVDVQKGVAQEAVLYWFQPAGRWPAGAAAEQLLHIADGLRGQRQYAFVRLSARMAPGVDPHRDLADLAARVAPAIRAALEGGAPAAEQQRTAHRDTGA